MPDYKRMLLQTYDAIVGEYAAHEFDNPIMERHYARFLSLLPAKSTVLDAGCGPGQAAQRFAASGHTVVGIDASQAMVEYARARVPKASFQQADVEDLQFLHRFHGIWAAFLLVHIERAKHAAVIKRFHELLLPGGVLFLGMLEGAGERVMPEPYDTRYEQYFVFVCEDEVRGQLRAGFEILEYSREQFEEEGADFSGSFVYARRRPS